MKTTPRKASSRPARKARSKHGSRTRSERQSGIAIVTVLSVLMLMSVLMLAFFSTASTELDASRHYSNSRRTIQLTDVVTNLVVAQLRKATAPERRGGIRTTWVSQPGAITTYTDKRSTSYARSVASKFKLYSSNRMIVPGKENLAADISGKWESNPAQWVDLNSPRIVERDDGRKEAYFPIIDPTAALSANPMQDRDEDSVEGFFYTAETSAKIPVQGVQLPGGDRAQQRLPMPVRWLYMLDDGTLGYLDDGNKFVKTSGNGTPSDINPMAARLAFWTDDESCKININTASEGVHWDIPRYDSPGERLLGTNQPTKGEVNRYPGHPAMVSLSSVFYPHRDPDDSDREDIVEEILKIAPKVDWGGSKAATVAPSGAQAAIDFDRHRLYATVDELLYRQSDDPENRSTDQERRVANDFFLDQKGKKRRDLLKRSRAFLTANSNAPELTMFGTPKMSLWPLRTGGGGSVFDRLLDQCTKLGNERYYWQRNDSTSRHQEVYVNAGAANLRLLYYYLAYLADERMPGYGRSWSDKYGAGESSELFQILTELWDQIRITNLYDAAGGHQYARRQGQIASCCLCGGEPRAGINGSRQHQDRWYRLNQNPAKGFGRLYSLSEVAVVLIPGAIDGTFEAGILFETFCPGLGFTTIQADAMMQATGPVTSRDPDAEDLVGFIGGQTLRITPGGQQRATTRGSLIKAMPWGGYGGPRVFSQTPVQFRFNGATGIPMRENIAISIPQMSVIMYDSPNGGVGNLIQVANMTFPATTVPAPTGSGMTWQQRLNEARSNPNTLIRSGDSVRSLVVSHGDFRLIAAKRVHEKEHFAPHHKYKTNTRHAHSLTMQDGTKYFGYSSERSIIANAAYPKDKEPDFSFFPSNSESAYKRIVGPSGRKFSYDPEESGDFGNGIGAYPDGAYIDRADDGSAAGLPNGNPYFDENLIARPNRSANTAFWMPNRLVSGPGLFGGLSSGVRENVPWRTLLFRPQPGEHYGAPNQPRRGDLPDHLFMDMFWMPVIEPYAISMPFATRGKINLNYQIVPFDNIKRQTALHAMMKAERVVAIPKSAAGTYKTPRGGEDSWRRTIDAYETLEQAEHRFADNELFRSPTEICELYLVPEDQNIGTPSGRDRQYTKMENFWKQHSLTGDNTKERPYANMVPRLTTKSNVYKVHMIVQTIKKVPSVSHNEFDPDRDKMTGQWRGSAIIERFIDPNDRNLPKYIGDEGLREPTLEYNYQYRILHVKQWSA